jgi:hypothetical protein
MLSSTSRWRAKPQPRYSTDDDDFLEEWMIGYPSAAARTAG